MSDNDAQPVKASGAGWSDRERLVYLFALVENASIKLDFANTPRPAGRTVIACQRMMDRLKNTLKDDLEALKAGHALSNANENGTPKTPKTAKRKSKAGNEDGSPKKRGRKKQGGEGEEEPVKVKEEPGLELDGET